MEKKQSAPAPASPPSHALRPRKQPSCTSANSTGALLDGKVTPQSITLGSLSRIPKRSQDSHQGWGGDSPGRAGARRGSHLAQAERFGRDRERWGAAGAEESRTRVLAQGGTCCHRLGARGSAPRPADAASSPLSPGAASGPSSPHQGLFFCHLASARRRGLYE